MAKDWYRRSTWTSEDQSDYLRIQAYDLAEVGDRELLAAALSLLDRMLAEYPDDFQASWAHEQRAECYVKTGDILRAVHCYRSALEIERGRPNSRSQAWLGFGWLAVAHRLTALYGEALAVKHDDSDVRRRLEALSAG